MHGISLGLANLPYRCGSAQGLSGGRLGSQHGCRDAGNATASSGASLGPISLGNMLSNLSSSIAELSSQLDSLATTVSMPDDWSGAISASGMGAQIISKQRGELQIHTQEGDVVTLKFSNKMSVNIDSQQLSDGTTSITNTSVDLHSRSRIGVSVAGDLNSDELAAIEDLVGKVGELTDDFFSGDMDSVLAQAMSLSYDTSQLADYSLDLSLKQSLSAYTYAVQLPAPVVADDTSTVAENTPAADVAAPLGDTAETTAVSAEPSVAVTDAGAADTHSTTANSNDSDTATVASDRSAVTQVVAEFVAKVRSRLDITATDTSLGFSYEFKARLLLSSIVQSAPADATPSAAALNYLQQQVGAGSGV